MVHHQRQTRVLPILRQDLSIHKGPEARDGSPSWVLQDPGRNRFFYIDRISFEVLSRWSMGIPEKIVEQVAAEARLEVTVDDVADIARFLVIHELVEARGNQARGMLEQHLQKQHWLKRLLRTYLFFRIHLLNPERFLSATYPYVRWVFSSWMLPLIILLGVMALFLVGRQWSSFTHALSGLYSWQGFFWFILALVGAKSIHELGHGYTAYRYGCRVTSMGVMFIVLTPVLYTDASEAWLLTSRKKRVAIGAAGMVAELGLAVVSTFLWSFLPDGGLRSAVLMIGASTWVRTLFINMMPYMRFDGYYVVSDLLGIPNLFDRSFAMGRWWLRERVFGLGDPPPEEWDEGTEKLLILFAFGVWIYRLVLFIGIALLVYHLFFKVLGIMLFLVEITWFILLPVYREVRQWYEFRNRIRWNRRSMVAVGVACALFLVFVLPWQTAVYVPALLRPSDLVVGYAAHDGIVTRFDVEKGKRVAKGALLSELASPGLQHKIAQAKRDVTIARWEMAASGADQQRRSQWLVAERSMQAARQTLEGLLEMESRLQYFAPFDAVIVQVARDMQPNQWVEEGTPLVGLAGVGPAVGEGYLLEADLARVETGDQAVFYPESLDIDPFAGHVRHIETVSSPVMHRPSLATIYGGGIPARVREDGQMVPEFAVYRVFWEPDVEKIELYGQFRGTLVVRGKPQSLAGRFWRAAIGVIIRESGF